MKVANKFYDSTFSKGKFFNLCMKYVHRVWYINKIIND